MEHRHFADFETSKLVKELGFDEQCYWVYDLARMPEFMGKDNPDNINSFYRDCDVCTRPTWQQVKEWLWEKHGITIYDIRDYVKNTFECRATKNRLNLTDKQVQILSLNQIESFNSPIDVEKEGMKQVVKYLYEQKK